VENISFIRAALDSIKRTTPNGIEFWSARDLMGILAYSEWRNFSEVIEKAKEACSNSGNLIANHFVDSDEMVLVGSGAKRKVDDWKMSGLACYLVAMNGDPSKPEVANAQAYFAIQTRLQETQQALPEIERRKMLRERIKNANKGLSSAAQSAGVRNKMFGIFHDEATRDCMAGLGSQL
jgi:DNA-damage-inducible protein D